ncbi:mechanosensitive ion channel domain-containing protein [Marinilabilia sp.]|uniref:mechanosensitive ion channel family protein n=1 Tax=Marinilabilia sp. TaxID=2021252 RepID=UPI0025BF48DB|nr:mechanosensitive ion channel domain-containing protein [Marinilabilia sp.]
MIDSLITEMPGYSEGWLLALDYSQYIQLALIVLILIIAWIFTQPGKMASGASEMKKIFLMTLAWVIRGIAVIGFSIWALSVLGLNIREFFGTPVVTIADEIPLSPFFLLTLVVGVYLLFIFNKFVKRFISNAAEKWRFDRNIAKQLRRFAMLLLFILLGNLWLQLAGSFLLKLFNDQLFSINEVAITAGVLVYALIILYGVSLGIRLIEVIYTRHVLSKGLNMGQSKTVFQLLKYALWVVAIVLVLDSVGINITVLVASSAALLVGLGFGIQGLFNDYISGLVVLFEGLIKVGDVVEIESELIGRVMDVGLRTSKILTRDNIIMIVPNHNFVGDKVINWSYNEQRTRFHVEVGVAYGSDVRLVERLLIESALEQDEVINEPKPHVLFRDFGDSSLDFRLFFWVEEVFYVEILKSKIRFTIDAKFRDNGVTIPFPQRDLHFKSGWEPKGG